MDECWICGAEDRRRVRPGNLPDDLSAEHVQLSDRAFGITAELFRCVACGFVSARRGVAERIGSLYEDVVDDEYLSSAEGRRAGFDRLMLQIRSRHPQGRTLLDIGAGIGLLCRSAEEAGLLAVGVEPSRWAVEQAMKEGGTVFQGYFPRALPEIGTFDVITAVDVIEHVEDPLEFLRAAARRLEPDGLLVVVTPDISSLVARMLRSKWWGYRPGHVGYFDRSAMALAFTKSGLQPIGSATFGRSLPLGYLILRLASVTGLASLSGWLSRRKALERFWSLPLVLNLRDTRMYFARRAS